MEDRSLIPSCYVQVLSAQPLGAKHSGLSSRLNGLLLVDPYELSPLDLSAPEHAALSTRLNGLLLASKACPQNSCRSPWSILHPNRSVATLRDALESKHHTFYASLPRVAFKECLDHQPRDNEEPYFPPLGDGVGPTLRELYPLSHTHAFGLGPQTAPRSGMNTGPARRCPFVPQ
ncbi:hypothetical protein C8Q76DRAFT_801980 [Earliella scabrosa]|nr:hypothetical protein C8Q76DRAFT_801980 [Earliella scabrosa]